MSRLASLGRVSALLLLAVAAWGPPAAAQVVDTLGVDSLGVDSLSSADSTLATDSALAGDSLGDWRAPFGEASFGDSTYAGPLPQDIATRIGYLTSAYPDTPGGLGLIETGMLEAEIAGEHARLAGQDSTDLSNMIRHMAHVLHAIDPDEVGQGPGMGYGFQRAAEAVRQYAAEVVAFDQDGPTPPARDVPGVIDFHAPYVVQAARGAVARADEAIAVARQVQRATSAEAAHRLVERLADLVRAMAYGDDRDRDGRIGYAESESGLAQARYHLRLVERLTSAPDDPEPYPRR